MISAKSAASALVIAVGEFVAIRVLMVGSVTSLRFKTTFNKSHVPPSGILKGG